MHTRSLALLALAAIPFAPAAQAQDSSGTKSDLRVLFVGHDPEEPQILFADSADERTVALYEERTAAFAVLLRARFEYVTIVHGPDYMASLSDGVDVTIFDARPSPLTEAVREVDPETGEMKYEAATYLPANFDRAALTISAMSPMIGEPLGLKLDWL